MRIGAVFRKLSYSWALAGLASAAVGIAAIQPAAAQEDITIGVVLPITSVLAPYGTPYVDALSVAVDEANADGGIDGRKIKLVVEDSQASNTIAINALNRVLQSDPVAVFGPALGTQILAMMPITEREKIPLIAGPSTQGVTDEGAKYFFRSSSPDDINKENWTRFIIDGLGKKKVGILHVANEWGYSGRDATVRFLDQIYGLKPVSIASYQPTDKDFTAQILQMQQDGADVIISQGHPVDEALLTQQMEQLGIQVPHVGSGSLCIAYLRKLVFPAEIAGHYCEGPAVIPSFIDSPEVQAFVETYDKKTGFPPDIYSAMYYDAMKMLIAVMKEAGVGREEIRKGMSETAYNGIIGTYKADEKGNLWHDAVIMEFLPDGEHIKVVRRASEAR